MSSKPTWRYEYADFEAELRDVQRASPEFTDTPLLGPPSSGNITPLDIGSALFQQPSVETVMKRVDELYKLRNMLRNRHLAPVFFEHEGRRRVAVVKKDGLPPSAEGLDDLVGPALRTDWKPATASNIELLRDLQEQLDGLVDGSLVSNTGIINVAQAAQALNAVAEMDRDVKSAIGALEHERDEAQGRASNQPLVARFGRVIHDVSTSWRKLRKAMQSPGDNGNGGDVSG